MLLLMVMVVSQYKMFTLNRYKAGVNVLCFRGEEETRRHLATMDSDEDR